MCRIGFADLHALGHRVAAAQTLAQAFSKRDGGHALSTQTLVLQPLGQSARPVDQIVDAVQHRIEHHAPRCRLRGSEEGPLAAGQHHPLEGNVDSPQALLILAAILQVVEDLQGGAKRVRRRLRRRAFPMKLQQVAPDRIGGEAAIRDKVRPVVVARLDRILPEGAQNLAGLGNAGPVLPVGVMKPCSLADLPITGHERQFERLEAGQLFGGPEIGVIGNVVGHAHVGIKGEHRFPMVR